MNIWAMLETDFKRIILDEPNDIQRDLDAERLRRERAQWKDRNRVFLRERGIAPRTLSEANL